MEKEAGLRPGVASSSRFLDDSGDLRRRVGWGRRRGWSGVFVFIVFAGFAVFFGVFGVERVVVDENEVGAGPFDVERKLVRFPTVEFLRRPAAFGDAADASRSGRFDENNEIDVAFPTDFEEKRRVENGELGVGGANGVEPTTKAGEQGRARRSVQKVEFGSRFGGRRENDFGQAAAVDGSARRNDRSAPTVAEDVENRRIVEKAAGFGVRVETGEAERSERRGRETFAGADSSDDGEKERAVFCHY